MDAFGFPFAEFCWYGVVSALFLLCFASLSYEVECGLRACDEAQHGDARKVTWVTFNVNFAAMVAAHLVFGLALIGAFSWQGLDARLCFAAAILTAGAYWSYTRACEKKLIAFLKTAGVYPPNKQ